MSSMSVRIAVVAAVLLVTLQLALVWAGYAYATRHLDRLLDGDLRTQASALLDLVSIDRATGPLASKLPQVVEYPAAARIATGFQYWGTDNALVVSSRNMQTVPLDAMPPGFANFSINGKKWRALTELDGGRWIRVVQRGDVRRAVQRSAAFWVLFLVGIDTPIVVGLILWTIGRGLAPIPLLAEQIGRRVPGRSDPISLGELPREFEPIVASVNGLLARRGVAGTASS